jgi:hypothetical protein
MKPENLNALTEAINSFSQHVAPTLVSVQPVALDSDPLISTLADGFYFYNTNINIPETLESGEIRLPYLIQRKTETNGSITIVAQSLHRTQALYVTTLVDGTTTGWGSTAGNVKAIISKPNGIFCFSAPLWLR